MTIPRFESELARRLRDAQRVAIVGIGDELHPADRLGMAAARRIEALGLPGVRVFMAGAVPETFTAPVRRFRPDHVLLLDAASMSRRAGTAAIVGPGNVRGAPLSTHALPLSVLMEYLARTAKAPVTLVGLQPSRRRRGLDLTAQERKGVSRLVRCLARVLQPRSTSEGGAR